MARLLLQSKRMQTDIHIIGGNGRVGHPLYIDLLKSMENSSSIGKVYSYVSTETDEDIDITAALSEANRLRDGISVELRNRLVSEQRTTTTHYASLDSLTDTLLDRTKKASDSGRKNMLVLAINYDMSNWGLEEGIDNVDELSQRDKTRIMSTVPGTTKENLAETWELLRSESALIHPIVQEYIENTIKSYLEYLEATFPGDENQEFRERIAKEIESIALGAKSKRGAGGDYACIGVKQFAIAMKKEKGGKCVDEFLDKVIIVTNPTDIANYVYSAVTDRDPSTVFCPQDNDRSRYVHRLNSSLGISLDDKDVLTIGPHNHWNMLVPEPILRYLTGLNEDEKLRALEEVNVHVNGLAEYQLAETGRTPSDYFHVIHKAIMRITKEEGPKRYKKVIMWSPDKETYVGWMGRITPEGIIPAPYHELFGNKVHSSTLNKWDMADGSIKRVIDNLVESGFIPRIEDTGLESKLETLNRKTPRDQTTRINPDAHNSELSPGEYIATTHYDRGRLFLSFVKKKEGIFCVEKLIELPDNLTPRSICYDEGEVYYSHSSGISSINLETGLSRNVLSVNELSSKHSVGINSIVINGDNIVFSVPGYGMGVTPKKSNRRESWENIADYSTNEHIGELVAIDNQLMLPHANGITTRKGEEWYFKEFTDHPLEIVLETARGVVALGRGNGYIELVHDNKTTRIPITNATPAQDYSNPNEYRRRLKATAHGERVYVVLHTGEGVIIDPIHQRRYSLTQVGTRNIDSIETIGDGIIVCGDKTAHVKEGRIDRVYEFATTSNPARLLSRVRIWE